MNQKILQKKLQAGEIIYLLDDFEEAVVRLVCEDDKTKSFLKYRGRKEVELPQSNETVCNIILGGKEISKLEYENY
jgi:hypothetical protein